MSAISLRCFSAPSISPATILLIGTSAQASAVVFVPGFEGDNLQGEEVGVGADGTTFVLSGTFNTDGIVAPFTSKPKTLLLGQSQGLIRLILILLPLYQ